MTKLLINLSLVFLFLTGNIGHAQEQTNLSSSDVKHFIDHFPALVEEFEKLDVDYDETSNSFDIPEGVDYLEDVNRIAKKHGYADFGDFSLKTATILAAYSAIKFKDESDGLGPEIQAALDEIESSEHYTPEQKEQMKDALMQSAEALQSLGEEMSDDENIAVVKPFVDQLDKILDN